MAGENAIRRFEDIEAWQLARKLANGVYDASESGKLARDFSLKDQIRRSGGLAMHNIAEGFDGGSNTELVKFLRYAYRSCTEIQSQLHLAADRGYIGDEQFDGPYADADHVRNKIGGLIRYLLEYEERRKRGE